jgi:hypothetical protein
MSILTKTTLARALVSGTVAAAAITIVASLASRRATGSYPAAINATSHALWPDSAARQDGYSWKYTGTGFLTNYGASIFWALVYEALAPRRRAADRREAALRGLGVSALAYVTDYYVVPRRLTPGFELRLPRRALAPIYAALALGLSLRDLLRRNGRTASTSRR